MLIIFDIEGVLVDGEFLPEVAKLMGREYEVAEITFKGIKGEIEWKAGLLRRIEMVKGVPYEGCVKICNTLPYMEGAKEACGELKRLGWKLAAVSGGPTLLSERVRKDLGLDYVFGNDLIFTGGLLETIDIHVDSDKAAAVKSLVDRLGEKKRDIVAVVDGANDITLFDLAGVKVAFNAQPLIREKADYVIYEKNLTLLLPIVKEVAHSRPEGRLPLKTPPIPPVRPPRL